MDNLWEVLTWAASFAAGLKAIEYYLLPKILKRKTQAETVKQEAEAKGTQIDTEGKVWTLYERSLVRIAAVEAKAVDLEKTLEALKDLMEEQGRVMATQSATLKAREYLLDRFDSFVKALIRKIRKLGQMEVLEGLEVPLWTPQPKAAGHQPTEGEYTNDSDR